MNTTQSVSLTLRRSLAALIASSMFCAVALLSGCNTTAGVGKDIKAAGNGLENAAEKAK